MQRSLAKTLLAATCATLTLAAVGCGTTTDAPGGGGGGGGQAQGKKCEGPQGDYTIGMSQANLAEPYRVRMDEDIRLAADKVPQFKGKVEFLDAAKDSAKQAEQVQTFVTKNVDLLIISPNEAAPLTSAVQQAYNKGIPVILLDRKINGDSYTQFIGADNVEIGRKAGEFYKNKLLPNGGKVVELKGLSGSTPANERAQGFRQGIKGSKIEVIDEADAEWERSVGQQKMNAMLKSNPQIDAVYSQNDPMAEGAYLAAQSAGRAEQIKFTGIDGLPITAGGIKSVEQGRLDATFVYPTGGKEAIDTAKSILIDCKKDVPKNRKLETQLVTKENAAQVYTELNKR